MTLDIKDFETFEAPISKSDRNVFTNVHEIFILTKSMFENCKCALYFS